MRFFCSAITDNRYARELFCSGSNLERYRTGGFGHDRAMTFEKPQAAPNLMQPVAAA